MKQNYLGRPILSSYVNKLKFCFSENKHRKKKRRHGRLRRPKTKKITLTGKMEGSLGKWDVSIISWKVKTDKNVFNLDFATIRQVFQNK